MEESTNGATGSSVGPLAEYEALRAEILQRMGMEQAVMLFQFASAGSVLSFALSASNRAVAAFLVALLSYLLGLRYFQLSLSVAQIGYYINHVLSAKVPGGFQWESWVNDQRAGKSFSGITPRFLRAAMFVGPAAVGWVIGISSLISNETYRLSERLGLGVLAALSFGLTALIVRSWLIHDKVRTNFRDEGGSIQ